MCIFGENYGSLESRQLLILKLQQKYKIDFDEDRLLKNYRFLIFFSTKYFKKYLECFIVDFTKN